MKLSFVAGWVLFAGIVVLGPKAEARFNPEKSEGHRGSLLCKSAEPNPTGLHFIVTIEDDVSKLSGQGYQGLEGSLIPSDEDAPSDEFNFGDKEAARYLVQLTPMAATLIVDIHGAPERVALDCMSGSETEL